MEKYFSTWQIADSNTARVRGMLYIYGYKLKLILRDAFPLQRSLNEHSYLVDVKQSFRSDSAVARLCPFNLLAPELFFLILAHPVYKM